MSPNLYSVGFKLRGNGQDKVDRRIEKELEARRPEKAFSRRDAVYSLDHTDFTVCGVVNPGYIYRVEPCADPQRWDFSWIGEMQKALLKLKYPEFAGMTKYPTWNAHLIAECCSRYWLGSATETPGWEFLAPSYTVVEVVARKLVGPKDTKGGWLASNSN